MNNDYTIKNWQAHLTPLSTGIDLEWYEGVKNLPKLPKTALPCPPWRGLPDSRLSIPKLPPSRGRP